MAVVEVTGVVYLESLGVPFRHLPLAEMVVVVVVFPAVERLQLVARGSFWTFEKVTFRCRTLPFQNRPVLYVHSWVVVLLAGGPTVSSIVIARMR